MAEIHLTFHSDFSGGTRCCVAHCVIKYFNGSDCMNNNIALLS